MGLAAFFVILGTAGSIHVLIVLYSINVFLTFTSAQLGMCVHWWKEKNENPKWKKEISVNGIGLMLTLCILISTIIIKFKEGGWVTLVITTSFILVCIWIQSHYVKMGKLFRRLDDTLKAIPFPDQVSNVPPKNTKVPTAVLMVTGYNGLGIHSLLGLVKTFPKHFKNIIFVSVGVLDSSKFKGAREVENLKANTEKNMKQCVELANRLGFYSEYHYSLGVDAIDELEDLCKKVAKEYSQPVFFSGKLIFKEENWITRLLHNQAALSIQQRLLYDGIQMVVLPIRVI